ncbi:MAG: hypothetical protein WA001_03875 [Patescibacteria group bacterium]
MQQKNTVQEWSLELLAAQYALAGKTFYAISVLAQPQDDPSFLDAWTRWDALEREWGRRKLPPHPLELFAPQKSVRAQTLISASFVGDKEGEFYYFAAAYREKHSAAWPEEAKQE